MAKKPAKSEGPKKRTRKSKQELLLEKGVKGLTHTESKLVRAFRALGMKRGSLEAAAEMAGISYAHARRLMSRTELSEHIELKKIPLQLGAVMDREERLRWLSDMIRDPSVGGRVQLGAMEMLNKLTNEYRQPGDDPANPIHVKEESVVRVSLEDRIKKLKGGAVVDVD
jgi:hypothetical protein